MKNGKQLAEAIDKDVVDLREGRLSIDKANAISRLVQVEINAIKLHINNPNLTAEE